MKITLNFSQFYNNWPESRKDQFSYEALRAIFDFIEDYERDSGEETEFDPIAICCDFSEYETALEAAKEYGFDPKDYDLDEDDDVNDEALDWLNDKTTVLELEGSSGVVIQQF